MSGQSTYNAAMSAAQVLEDFVDEMTFGPLDNPELRNQAHVLRRKLEAFAMTVRPAHLGGPVSETPASVAPTTVSAPIPPGLCGFRGCVFLTNHEKGPHSWQVA